MKGFLQIGDKFVTLVLVIVMALGTLVGYASDRIQRERRQV